MIGRQSIDQYIDVLKLQFTKNYNEKNEEIEALKRSIGEKNYNIQKDLYSNEALNDQVSNRREAEKYVVEDGEIKRKDAPIFNVDKSLGLFEAPFYAPYKFIFGNRISTFWSNILILWIFVLGMSVALYTDVLKRSIEWINYLRERYLKFK
jgi:hypothetical protein